MRIFGAVLLLAMVGCGSSGGGTEDAGLADAGFSDAGFSDAGFADAGSPDGGLASDAGGPQDGGADGGADGGTAGDGGPADGGSPDAGLPDRGLCVRSPQAPDRTRKVVVSHPYTAAGSQANAYEVLELSAAGVLSQTGDRFEMGRSTEGEIVFTPDGEVGIVVQDDGTLGVFRFDTSGLPEVVHASFRGGFYASAVVVAPGGEVAYVLDGNWRENGGGLYRVGIGCDGRLSDLGLWTASKSPGAMRLLPTAPDLAVVAAADLDTSSAAHDVHLIRRDASPLLVGGADAFVDNEEIVSSLALTADAKYALVGDNNAFSGIPNRVAVVAVTPTSLTATQVLTPIEDPVAIVASPFNNAALVVSGFGDALFALSYSPASTAAPFANEGEVTYSGAAPQLPYAAVLVDRGSLRGHVLVSELLGVRRLRFEPQGSPAITDLGLTSLGSGSAAITGALGVQP